MRRDAVEIYRAQSVGGKVGSARRPALCIVEFVNRFIDPALFGGGNMLEAAAHSIELLAAARQRGMPVAFSGEENATMARSPARFRSFNAYGGHRLPVRLRSISSRSRMIRFFARPPFVTIGHCDWLKQRHRRALWLPAARRPVAYEP